MKSLSALFLVLTLAATIAGSALACPAMVFSGSHTTGTGPHFSWRRMKREKLKHDNPLEQFDPHLRRHPQQTWA